MQYTSNWKNARPNIAIQDIKKEGGKDAAAPEADDIIARHGVTNIVDQGKIRAAGARRDVESGLLPANGAINRHKIINPQAQRALRLYAAKFEVRSGGTSEAAIQKHDIREEGDKGAVLRAREKFTKEPT